MKWFDYSIIKYMPNPKRGEVVNIGLVVFKKPDVDVRILEKSSKANIVDNEVDYNNILNLKDQFEALSNYIQDPEEQFNILKGSGFGVFLSEKGKFSIESEDYEIEVTSLFNELVDFKNKKKEVSKSRIQTLLRKKFEELNIFSNDKEQLNNHKVIHNYKLNNHESDLVVDFIVKNGKYHVTETVDFNLNDKNSKVKEACFKSMIFSEAERLFANELGKRFFVYSANAKKESEMETSLNFVRKNCEEIYNIDSEEEKNKYFDNILKLIKV